MKNKNYSAFVRKKSFPFKYEKPESAGSAFHISQAPQFLQCMGSIMIEDSDREIHPLTQKGIDYHTKVAFAFRKFLKGQEYEFEVEDDYKFVKDFYNVLVKMYKSKKWTCMGVECYFTTIFMNYLMGGYIDYFYYDKDTKTVKIVDLKTGVRPQQAKVFDQLKAYGLMIWEYFKLPHDTKFILSAYTRYGEVNKEVDLKELLIYKNAVSKRIQKFEFNVGEHCADCFNFNRCRVAQNVSKNLVKEMSKTKPKYLSKYMKHERLINKYFDSVKKEILNRFYKTGKTRFGNLHVTETRGAKQWKYDKLSLIKRIGGIYKEEKALLSPTQAMKKGLNIEGLWRLVKSKKIIYKEKKKCQKRKE